MCACLRVEEIRSDVGIIVVEEAVTRPALVGEQPHDNRVYTKLKKAGITCSAFEVCSMMLMLCGKESY